MAYCAKDTAQEVFDFLGLDTADPELQVWAIFFKCVLSVLSTLSRHCCAYTRDLSSDVHIVGPGHVWRWGC